MVVAVTFILIILLIDKILLIKSKLDVVVALIVVVRVRVVRVRVVRVRVVRVRVE